MYTSVILVGRTVALANMSGVGIGEHLSMRSTHE